MIVVAVILLARDLRPRRLRSIVGSVVTLNPDPRKQASIADVEITAVDGDEVAKSRSDSSGFFQVHLQTEIWRGRTVNLKFRHPDYEPLDITEALADRIALPVWNRARAGNAWRRAGRRCCCPKFA